MASTRRIVVVGVCSLALVGTHVGAYFGGLYTSYKEHVSLRDSLTNGVQVVKLEATVEVLRMAVRHPSEFPPDKLSGWRLKSEQAVVGVEKQALPYIRRTGNEPEIKRVEGLVAEANDLLAKLPPKLP